jgi:hypothetical protein
MDEARNENAQRIWVSRRSTGRHPPDLPALQGKGLCGKPPPGTQTLFSRDREPKKYPTLPQPTGRKVTKSTIQPSLKIAQTDPHKSLQITEHRRPSYPASRSHARPAPRTRRPANPQNDSPKGPRTNRRPPPSRASQTRTTETQTLHCLTPECPRINQAVTTGGRAGALILPPPPTALRTHAGPQPGHA